MALSIQDYLDEMLQEVSRIAEASGNLINESFTGYVAELLIETGELRDYSHTPFTGQRGLAVDGYDSDPKDTDDVLTLVISDYVHSSPSGTLTRTDMDALFKRVTNFVAKSLDEDFRFELEPTSPVYELADLIAARWSYIEKIRVILVTNKLLSTRIDGRDHGVIEGKRVTYSVWDLGRFYQLETSGSGREELVIDLIEEFGDGLPAIDANLADSGYQSYLVVVPGPQLAAIYDRWRDRLLEQNVRVFLQARSSVNRGIRETIRQQPEMFFAYNNGLSATAESVDVRETHRGLQICAIRNLQIVNGAQTTASVHAARKTDPKQLERVSVQMKLSIIPPERSNEVVPKISEYANSQNTVSKADFFSNHPFHVQIENASRRIYAPSVDGTFRQSKWFYERARGQYLDTRGDLTGARRSQWDLEYPKAQLFTKTDLAKFDTVWRMLPHEVSKGAQKVFQNFAGYIEGEWERNEAGFNDQTFRDYIAKVIVFRSTERLVSKASWYEGGYRANIVAYGISKLAREIGKMGKSLDFDKIWRSQSISEGLAEALLSCSMAAQDIILNPVNVRNISEWAKRSECWDALRETRIDLPASLDQALIDKDKETERRGDGVKFGKIDLGINAQVRVMKAGPDYWNQVRDWGNEYRLLGGKDLGILKVATTSGKFPSEKQSVYLVDLVEKLGKEGFPFADKL